MQSTNVLQPGWYRLVRDGHANARYFIKPLQIGTIIGRPSTG
jgi:hypothetical protein